MTIRVISCVLTVLLGAAVSWAGETYVGLRFGMTQGQANRVFDAAGVTLKCGNKRWCSFDELPVQVDGVSSGDLRFTTDSLSEIMLAFRDLTLAPYPDNEEHFKLLEARVQKKYGAPSLEKIERQKAKRFEKKEKKPVVSHYCWWQNKGVEICLWFDDTRFTGVIGIGLSYTDRRLRDKEGSEL